MPTIYDGKRYGTADLKPSKYDGETKQDKSKKYPGSPQKEKHKKSTSQQTLKSAKNDLKIDAYFEKKQGIKKDLRQFESQYLDGMMCITYLYLF